jgi:hypothetical protein
VLPAFWDAPISQLGDRVVPATRLFGPLAEKTRQVIMCTKTSPTVSAQVAQLAADRHEAAGRTSQPSGHACSRTQIARFGAAPGGRSANRLPIRRIFARTFPMVSDTLLVLNLGHAACKIRAVLWPQQPRSRRGPDQLLTLVSLLR